MWIRSDNDVSRVTQLLTFLLFGPLLPSATVDGDGLSLPKGLFRHAPAAGLRRFRRLGEVSGTALI